MFWFVVLIGCGGGGDDGGNHSPTAYVGFTTEDFSGKSIYYTTTEIYQLAVFYPDGTAQGSLMMTSGTPVLEPEIVQWSIVDGELIITSMGDSVRYRLISDDTVERCFKANKYSQNGIVKVVYMFYDQQTGLAQAQAYVANN